MKDIVVGINNKWMSYMLFGKMSAYSSTTIAVVVIVVITVLEVVA